MICDLLIVVIRYNLHYLDMNFESEESAKKICKGINIFNKVGVLGDSRVGKTYLTYKLAGKEYG